LCVCVCVTVSVCLVCAGVLVTSLISAVEYLTDAGCRRKGVFSSQFEGKASIMGHLRPLGFPEIPPRNSRAVEI